MDGEQIERQAEWLNVLKANQSFFVLFGIGVMLLVFGLFLFFQEKMSGPTISISRNEATSASVVSSLKVDVEGAVIRSGVYELSGGARLQDALVAAGGLAGDADRDFVSKNINLAAKVVDGGKVYIPKRGERVAAVSGQGTVTGVDVKLNINSASEGVLDKLPGVGTVTAQKIISGRPYSKIDDLVSKKVLGQSAYDKIKGMIEVY